MTTVTCARLLNVATAPVGCRWRCATQGTGWAALAYLRTALTLIIADFSLMQFFRDNAYVWAGTLLAPLGVGTGVAGWLRYRRKRARIGI